jgi:hypothetical protein
MVAAKAEITEVINNKKNPPLLQCANEGVRKYSRTKPKKPVKAVAIIPPTNTPLPLLKKNKEIAVRSPAKRAAASE